jgi:hypothetical protein
VLSLPRLLKAYFLVLSLPRLLKAYFFWREELREGL